MMWRCPSVGFRKYEKDPVWESRFSMKSCSSDMKHQLQMIANKRVKKIDVTVLRGMSELSRGRELD